MSLRVHVVEGRSCAVGFYLGSCIGVHQGGFEEHSWPCCCRHWTGATKRHLTEEGKKKRNKQLAMCLWHWEEGRWAVALRGIDREGDERPATGPVPVALRGRAMSKLQALVYDILPLEEGAGKRCSESGRWAVALRGIDREGDEGQTTGPVPVALRGIEREGDERRTTGSVPVALRGIEREGDERRTTGPSCACGIEREGDERRTTGPSCACGIEREGDERRTTGRSCTCGIERAMRDEQLAVAVPVVLRGRWETNNWP